MRQFCILLISFGLIFSSCNKKNRFEIDTEKEKIEVKIRRFDKDLILLDSTNPKANIENLYREYEHFLPIYTAEVLGADSKDVANINRLFLNFKNDSTFKKVNKKTLETFEDIADIEKIVSDSYTYIHHYFPEITLPEIYFMVTGFNRSVMMNEKFIAFSTDLYLGSDYPLYKDFSYDYMLYNMRRESMAVDIVSTILFRMFTLDINKDKLLDQMIFRGKVMYILSVFMPNEKPENLMGYTKEQWEWCEIYKKDIWGSVINQKDLFSTNTLLINKYMNEAPFTAPVSQDSPGRLGTWLGWQIVDSYMNKNSDVGLKNLMDEKNSLQILENSGFKP